MSLVTTTVFITSRQLPRDSRHGARSGRDWAAAIFALLLRVLAFHPVRDLVESVDRMPIRLLLKPRRRSLQPDSAWTINRTRCAPYEHADGRAKNPIHLRVLGNNDDTKSRVPRIVESPMQRISAEHDETRDRKSVV